MTDTTYTCKNHPDMRWWSNGRNIRFAGELPTEAHPTGRPNWEGASPFKTLEARMGGWNPFLGKDFPGTDEEPSIKTWADVIQYVQWVEKIETQWVFECECSSKDLVATDEDINDLFHLIRLPEEVTKS